MMPNAPFQIGGPVLAPELLTILAGSTLKVTLLLLVAVGAGLALRRASAARRHLLWTVAVVATLAMPLLSAAMPRLAVPVPELELPLGEPGYGEAHDPVTEASAALVRATSVRGAPRVEPRPAPDRTPEADPATIRERAYAAVGVGERERREDQRLRTDALESRTRSVETRVTGLEERVTALEALARLPRAERRPERDAPASPPHDFSEAPSIAAALASVGGTGAGGPPDPSSNVGLAGLGPARILLGLWGAGFLTVLGALFLGMARLGWIRRRSARLAAGPLAWAADRVAARLGLTRRPILLQGDDTAMPMTWGLSRSYILLPAGAEAWETWRLEAVLLHELAHVARRDYAAQVAAHVACALYWFHPLVWIAAHRLRVEREQACDDVVVSAGTDAPTYARELLEIARSLRVGPAAARAALGMARSDHLQARLLALLDERRDRSPLATRRVASAWGLGLCLVLPLAALGPVSGQASSPSEEAEAGSEHAPTAATAVATAATARASASREITVEPPVARATALALGAIDRVDPLAMLLTPGLRAPQLHVPATRPAQEATALCGPADGEMQRSSHMTDDDLTVIETEYGRCRTSVRIEGDVRFGDDFRSIASLSRGGLLRLEVSRDGDRQRMEIRPGAGGAPEYRWSVDGRERPFDEAAERWLEAALVDLFRTTGFQAEERVAFILEREGPEGVLAEVSRMRTDHARARYLQVLLERGRLSAEQVRRVIELGAREIDSDHSLAGILTAAAERHSFDPPTRGAFIAAAASLDSDHHQANVLSTALARDDLDQANLTALLEQAAAGIESDHHVASILTQLAGRYPLEPALREPFLRAAGTLDSDHHRANVYGVVLAQRGLRAAELATVLEAARRIQSDHHLASVLLAAAEHDLSDETLRRAFLGAAGSIESAHHRRNVFSTALGLEGLSAEDLATILVAAGEIDSDHHLAGLLIEVSKRDLSDAAMQRAYLEAAAGIGSDHHLARALTALVDRDDLRPAELALALRAARSIGSDHQLAELLLITASRHELEGEVADEFRRALDTIQSEHHHGRVASRIVRSGV